MFRPSLLSPGGTLNTTTPCEGMPENSIKFQSHDTRWTFFNPKHAPKWIPAPTTEETAAPHYLGPVESAAPTSPVASAPAPLATLAMRHEGSIRLRTVILRRSTELVANQRALPRRYHGKGIFLCWMWVSGCAVRKRFEFRSAAPFAAEDFTVGEFFGAAFEDIRGGGLCFSRI